MAEMDSECEGTHLSPQLEISRLEEEEASEASLSSPSGKRMRPSLVVGELARGRRLRRKPQGRKGKGKELEVMEEEKL